MIVVRHADDFVVGFQRRWEAESFLKDLKERLAKFGLDLHPDKTRLIEFGRLAKADRKRRGLGKPETFDFMGMTHYCATTRRGKFRVGRKPSRKRVGRTLRRIWEALRMRMHLGEHEVAIWLGRVIKGPAGPKLRNRTNFRTYCEQVLSFEGFSLKFRCNQSAEPHANAHMFKLV